MLKLFCCVFIKLIYNVMHLLDSIQLNTPLVISTFCSTICTMPRLCHVHNGHTIQDGCFIIHTMNKTSNALNTSDIKLIYTQYYSILS